MTTLQRTSVDNIQALMVNLDFIAHYTFNRL